MVDRGASASRASLPVRSRDSRMAEISTKDASLIPRAFRRSSTRRESRSGGSIRSRCARFSTAFFMDPTREGAQPDEQFSDNATITDIHQPDSVARENLAKRMRPIEMNSTRRDAPQVQSDEIVVSRKWFCGDNPLFPHLHALRSSTVGPCYAQSGPLSWVGSSVAPRLSCPSRFTWTRARPTMQAVSRYR